jgi:hypothetical protein
MTIRDASQYAPRVGLRWRRQLNEHHHGDSDGGFNYAVVDDVTNNLSVYRLPSQ